MAKPPDKKMHAPTYPDPGLLLPTHLRIGETTKYIWGEDYLVGPGLDSHPYSEPFVCHNSKPCLFRKPCLRCWRACRSSCLPARAARAPPAAPSWPPLPLAPLPPLAPVPVAPLPPPAPPPPAAAAPAAGDPASARSLRPLLLPLLLLLPMANPSNVMPPTP